MQVDPITPTLKAPGTKRLKLKHDESLSNFAFKFNLRRYAEELFDRDLQCLHKFFLRRYNYRADLDDAGAADPVFTAVAGGGQGRAASGGAIAGPEKSIDVALRASGFSTKVAAELEKVYDMKRATGEEAGAYTRPHFCST